MSVMGNEQHGRVIVSAAGPFLPGLERVDGDHVVRRVSFADSVAAEGGGEGDGSVVVDAGPCLTPRAGAVRQHPAPQAGAWVGPVDGVERVDAASADEHAIADLIGLVAKTSNHVTTRDYDVRIGVEWAGEGPMTFEVRSHWDDATSAELSVYTPILATIQTDTESDDYHDTVYALICDAVNQVGVQEPQKMARREAGQM